MRINSGLLRLEWLIYFYSALLFYPLKQRGNDFPTNSTLLLDSVTWFIGDLEVWKEFGISKWKPEAWGRKQTKVWKWWRVTNETIMVMKAPTRFLSAIPRPSQEPVFFQFHRPNNSFKKDLSFRTRFIAQFMALICIKGDANRGAW